MAAVWDRDLIYRHGAAMGREFREKGINIALTPGMKYVIRPTSTGLTQLMAEVSPVYSLARSLAAGRNYEYAGGDVG